MLAAVIDLTLEFGLARERGNQRLAGVSGTEDDVVGTNGTGLTVAYQLDGPFRDVIIESCAGQGGLGPYVELHERGVSLEPVTQFVLGRELRPVFGEGEVGQVSKLGGVVCDKSLM